MPKVKNKTKADFSKIQYLKEAKALAKKTGVNADDCDTIGEVMISVFEEKVKPEIIQPTIVYDYPIEAAGLAKATDRREYFVSSFEI